MAPTVTSQGNRYIVVHLAVNARSVNSRPRAYVSAFGLVKSSPARSWSFSSAPNPRLLDAPLAAEAVAPNKTYSRSVEPGAVRASANAVAACCPGLVRTYRSRPKLEARRL